MKLLLDMNLSPSWVPFLIGEGFATEHWSEIGDPRAPDTVLMAWAREHGAVLFTHDLDFSALLAHTYAAGPSVLQMRTQDVLPDAMGDVVLATLRTHEAALGAGAIVTLDHLGSRVRVLPVGRSARTRQPERGDP